MAELKANDGAGYIVGADTGETIRVVDFVPSAGADTGVDILAGAGNDTITGHDGHNYINPGAGDDTVSAGGGSDYIQASAGADTIDGGAGDDVLAIALPDGTSGTLFQSSDSNGNVLVKLDGVTIFTITSNSDGSVLITGAAGTAGAAFGTETVSNIEQVQITRPSNGGDGGSTLHLAMQVKLFPNGSGNGGWAMGSINADTINLDTSFPGITASTDGSWVQGAGADGGAGNDTITGTAGSDFFVASPGADTINGGAGSDNLSFQLAPGTTGSLTQGVDSNGNLAILLDSTVILTITASGGGYVIAGVAGTAGEVFGTETIANIERINVQRQPAGGDSGSYLDFSPGLDIYRYGSQQGGWVRGTAAADTVDLGAIFSDITASTNGSWVQGAGADAGAGNDTITGTPGSDYIMASAGDDTINGGAGSDGINFTLPSGTTGTLTHDLDGSGNIVIKLDSTVIFTITSSNGSYTVQGMAGTAGEGFGKEVLTSIEDLNISRYPAGGDNGSWLNLGLGIQTYKYDGQNGGWVRGSVASDNIDLSAIFTGITASTDGSWVSGAGVDPGAGNDTVTGTAGSDYFYASPGNDTIHGGAGNDNMYIALPYGTTGTLAQAAGANGELQITLDGTVICTVTKNGGSYTIAGVAGTAGAAFGTETVDSIENVTFWRSAINGDDSSYLNLGLGVQVYTQSDGKGGWVTGSAMSDSINLASLFPGIQPSSTGAYVSGAGVDAGMGNDSITGSAGADYIYASQGNDTVDGGAGDDVLYFNLPQGTTGVLATTTPAGGGFSVTLDGVAIATVTPGANGSYVIAGIAGTPGADFGTETVSNVERVQFSRPYTGVNDTGNWLSLDMDVRIYRYESGGGYVQGSFQADNVNLATLFPEITAGTDGSWVSGIGMDPGAGNDTVTGTPGADYFQASAGSDTIDGAAGQDTLSFNLYGTAGTLTQDVDSSGNPVIKLDGTVIIQSARNANGTITLTGVTGTAGEKFGAETIKNIESVQFNSNGSNIDLRLGVQVFHSSDNKGGWVTGSSLADTIDLATEFPELTASANGGWAQGAGADPGAGNDTVKGTVGSDYFQASEGNDTIDGGTGDDGIMYMLAGSGKLGYTTAGNGDIQVLLGETAVVNIVKNSDGSFTASGVAGTAGEKYGTETLRNVERLNFFQYDMSSNSSNLSIDLTVRVVHYENSVGGSVTGSSMDDTINLATTFPDIKSDSTSGWSQGASVDPGLGNDKVTGSVGNDYIVASPGNDTIDGGAGNDNLQFMLQTDAGALTYVAGSNGDEYVKANGVTAFTIVHNTDATITVTGMAGTAGAAFGTETVRNVESLNFIRFGSGSDAGDFLTLNPEVTVSTYQSGASITGTARSEQIDVAKLLPAAATTTNLWINVNPGLGDDTVTGTANHETFQASEGADMMDGGAGNDSLSYQMGQLTGTLTAVAAGAGKVTINAGGTPVVDIKHNADNSFTLTGIEGTAAAKLGTETVKNIENFNFWHSGKDSAGNFGSSLYVTLETQVVHNTSGKGGTVTGTTFDDTLHLPTLFPGIEASKDGSYVQGVFADGGAGDDVITGTAGDDTFQVSSGNDVIDGGAGRDTMSVNFSAQQGAAVLAVAQDSTGSIAVTMDGTTVASITRNDNGSMTLAGVAGTAGANVGTQTLTSVEALSLYAYTNGAYSSLMLNLTPTVGRYEWGGGSYTGTLAGEKIDLPALFPEIVTANGAGVNVMPDRGNDQVTGTMGNDTVAASVGDDTVNGGDGFDTLNLELPYGTTGKISTSGSADAIQLQLDGVTIATVTRQGPDGFSVTGVAGTAGEWVGTETLTSVETLNFSRSYVSATDGYQYLELGLVQRVIAPAHYVAGTAFQETLDLPALFPDIVAGASGVVVSGAQVRSGAGNGTVLGTVGNDTISASPGSDIIKGGAGSDTLTYSLGMLPDGSVLTQSTAANGDRLVKLGDTVLLTMHKQDDGAILLTGSDVAARFGTETISEVETVSVDYYTQLTGQSTALKIGMDIFS